MAGLSLPQQPTIQQVSHSHHIITKQKRQTKKNQTSDQELHAQTGLSNRKGIQHKYQTEKNEPPKDIAGYSRPSNLSTPIQKGRTTQGLNRNDRSLTLINSTGSTQKTQQTNKDRNTIQIQNKINNTVPIERLYTIKTREVFQ